MNLGAARPWAALGGMAALALPGAWLAHAALGLALRPEGGWAWAWALAVAPLIEEAVLRPLLQQGLWDRMQALTRPAAAWPGHAANLFSALAFVALHVPGRGWDALWWLAPAVLLGEAWRRHRSLAACAGLHAWFNLCLAGVSRA
ncbi:lysostaphin resistance A-like protein [Ramlibacter sp.]|uniref:CPBP family intramembrane glutamic endopeptidase n=1 Tax=Ramlibacter sp. TaxID=1917967 RepID=UPI0035AEB330